MHVNANHRQFLWRAMAPYLAVAVFWCWLSHAWLAILAYHAQVIAWLLVSGREQRPVRPSGIAGMLVTPSVAAGLALWVMLPFITRMELGEWLAMYGLPRRSLLFMVPYFGLVHPVLEQLHWGPLRERTAAAHLLFAGYHVLVLHSLLRLPWLAACFGLLAAASMGWGWMTRRTNSLVPAIISHGLADGSVVVVAWVVTYGAAG